MLATQLLTEALLLGAAGAAAAVIVALWGGATLRTFLLPQVGAVEAVLNCRVMAFTTGVAILAAVLCGVLPALAASRADPAAALKSGGQAGASASTRGQAPLIVGQVALTLVLLVAAGLFIESLQNLRARAGGLEVQRLLMVTTDAAGSAGADPTLLYDRIRDRLVKVPGVTDASPAVFMPLTSAGALSFTVPGVEKEPKLPGGSYIYPVGSDWFETAGTRILTGRGFTAADRAGAPTVAVVNETMAHAYWPGGAAIGKCIMLESAGSGQGRPSERCYEVVGVAENVVRIVLRDEPDAQYYVPLGQSPGPWSPRYVLVRTTGRPEATIPAIRKALQDVAPDLPYVTVQPLTETYGWRQLRPWQMAGTLFGAFATLGLVLASAGLFGLVSFLVTRRTPEMAVRMALGADGRAIGWLFVRRGLALALIGVVIGIAGAIGLGRALASLLFGVSPSDPVLLGAGAAVLVAVAGVASWIPARRATHMDPATALRAE
jgi:predicted permease